MTGSSSSPAGKNGKAKDGKARTSPVIQQQMVESKTLRVVRMNGDCIFEGQPFLIAANRQTDDNSTADSMVASVVTMDVERRKLFRHQPQHAPLFSSSNRAAAAEAGAGKKTDRTMKGKVGRGGTNKNNVDQAEKDNAVEEKTSLLLSGSSLGQMCKHLLDAATGDSVPLRSVVLLDMDRHKVIDDDDDVCFDYQHDHDLAEEPAAEVFPPRGVSEELLQVQRTRNLSEDTSLSFDDTNPASSNHQTQTSSTDPNSITLQVISKAIPNYELSAMLSEMLDSQFEVAAAAVFDNDFEFGAEKKCYAREEWSLGLYQCDDAEFAAVSDPGIDFGCCTSSGCAAPAADHSEKQKLYQLRRKTFQVLDELQKVLSDENFFSRGMVQFLDFAHALVKSRHFPLFEQRTRRFSALLAEFAKVSHPRFRNLRGLIELTHERLVEVFSNVGGVGRSTLYFYKLVPAAWDCSQHFRNLDDDPDRMAEEVISPTTQMAKNQREGCRLVAERLRRLLPPDFSREVSSTSAAAVRDKFGSREGNKKMNQLVSSTSSSPGGGSSDRSNARIPYAIADSSTTSYNDPAFSCQLSDDEPSHDPATVEHVSSDVLRFLATMQTPSAQQQQRQHAEIRGNQPHKNANYNNLEVEKTFFSGDGYELFDGRTGRLKAAYHFDPVKLATAGIPSVVFDCETAERLCLLNLVTRQSVLAEVLTSLLRSRSIAHTEDDGTNAVRFLRQVFGVGAAEHRDHSCGTTAVEHLASDLKDALLQIVKRDLNRTHPTAVGNERRRSAESSSSIPKFVSPEFARLAKMRSVSGSAVEDYLSLTDVVEQFFEKEWGQSWHSTDTQRNWRRLVLAKALEVSGTGRGNNSMSPVELGRRCAKYVGNRLAGLGSGVGDFVAVGGSVMSRTQTEESACSCGQGGVVFALSETEVDEAAGGRAVGQPPPLVGSFSSGSDEDLPPLVLRAGDVEINAVPLFTRVVLLCAALTVRDPEGVTVDLKPSDNATTTAFGAFDFARLLEGVVAEAARSSSSPSSNEQLLEQMKKGRSNMTSSTGPARPNVLVSLAFASLLCCLFEVEEAESGAEEQVICATGNYTSSTTSGGSAGSGSASRERSGESTIASSTSVRSTIVTAEEADVLTEYELQAMAYYGYNGNGGETITPETAAAAVVTKPLLPPRPEDELLNNTSSKHVDLASTRPQLAIVLDAMRSVKSGLDKTGAGARTWYAKVLADFDSQVSRELLRVLPNARRVAGATSSLAVVDEAARVEWWRGEVLEC